MSPESMPTERDRENAALRQAIADRQAGEYGQVVHWAWGKFGPGWLPSGRHFLLSKDEEERCRRSGEPAIPAATVYTARHQDSGDKRHFTVDEDGRVTEVAGYEEGFGPMLLESDPVRTIEVRGEQVHPHRYSLCWAPFELYHPRSADQLAALRASRERNKAAREEASERAANPLFTTWAEQQPQKDQEASPAARPPVQRGLFE